MFLMYNCIPDSSYDYACSGMLVQDPSKHNDVDSIFDRARQVGATQGPLENVVPSSSSTSFTGTGRTLAGETVPTSAPQPPESIVHNIIFWRNGFTVNDGPLRRLDDPENASFLEVTVVRTKIKIHEKEQTSWVA